METLRKKMKFSPDDAIAVIGAPPNHLLRAQVEAMDMPYSEDLNGTYSWIVRAKRSETKQQRLEKVIPYLQAQRKNPAVRKGLRAIHSPCSQFPPYFCKPIPHLP